MSGREQGEMGSDEWFYGYRVSFWGDENVSKLDGDDGCIALECH